MSGSPWWEAGGFFFLVLLRSFFFVRSLRVFLEAMGGPMGAIGSILEPFGEHFGVIFVTFKG